MRISLFLLLGLCLSLTISCNCQPMPVDTREDAYGAKLFTESIERLGSINKNPVILQVCGKIQDNKINGKSTTGLIIIPEDQKIAEAAKELVNLNDNPTSSNVATQLPGTKGLVYYGEDIPANEHKSLCMAIALDTSQLQATTTYTAYLVAVLKDDNNAKQVFYSKQGEVVDPTLLEEQEAPTISMVSGEATKKPGSGSSGEQIQLSLQGKVTGKTAGFKGGFLLVKADGAEFDFMELVKATLPEEESLKQLAGFDPVFTYSKLGSSLNNPNAVTNKPITITELDTAKLLARGATYKVYFYLIDQRNNYTVSKEEIAVTIPKPQVKLKMEEVAIETLLGNMTKGTMDTLALKVKGDIQQQQGTSNPYFGFLLVKGGSVTSEAATAKIKEKISGSSVVKQFYKTTSNDLIYVASKPGKNLVGKQEFVANGNAASFALGTAYTVYCWLKDGNEVFVSPNSHALEIPKVTGKITSACFSKNVIEKQALKMTMTMDIKDRRYFPETNNECGFLFVEEPSSGTIADFQRVLDHARALDKAVKAADESGAPRPDNLEHSLAPFASHATPHKLELRVNSRHVVGSKLLVEKSRYGHDHTSPFRPETEYRVHYWLRDGNTLFYTDAFTNPVKTSTDFHESEPPIVVTDQEVKGPLGDPKIEYWLYPNAKVINEHNTSTKEPKSLKKSIPADLALINQILAFAIKDDIDDPAAPRIAEFINRMPL